MTPTNKHSTKKRVVLAGLWLLLAVILVWLVELAIPKQDYFSDRAGGIEDFGYERVETDIAIEESLDLVSDSGLRVRLRVRRPLAAESPVPVLLVLGGYRTGRNAVDLAGVPDGVAFAAVDYPYTGSRSLQGFRQYAGAIPKIQQAFLDSPAALILGVEWLARQSWADKSRIELVGVSLGVPFAAVAGGLDDRFSRVWLLHGGADNVSWAAHAGRDDIENDLLRRLTARALIFLLHGNSFDTVAWIEKTAPRPVVIVIADNDDFVPAEAQQPFVEIAENDHVELIRTDGRHVRPGRDDVLSSLLEVVLSRISN